MDRRRRTRNTRTTTTNTLFPVLTVARELAARSGRAPPRLLPLLAKARGSVGSPPIRLSPPEPTPFGIARCPLPCCRICIETKYTKKHETQKRSVRNRYRYRFASMSSWRLNIAAGVACTKQKQRRKAGEPKQKIIKNNSNETDCPERFVPRQGLDLHRKRLSCNHHHS